MTPRKYTLLRDRFEHKAGITVYDFHRNTYGLTSDDQRTTGVEHTAVTLDPTGDYPFFTVPRTDIQEVLNDT